MTLSHAGRAFIQSFEVKRNIGFLPTPNDKPTAGWGHTGLDVSIGKYYSDDQCNDWFERDTGWAVSTVNDHVRVEITQNQFDALVSICFNIGAPNFDSSTLLKDMDSGAYEAAADQFLVWDKQRGQELSGLERRRVAERAMFEAA